MKNKFIKVLSITLLSGSIALASTPSLANAAREINLNDSNYSMMVAENDTLEDGKYNVSIETLKENSDELSMAGQYMNKKALLEVEGQNMYMTLTLTKIEWMKDIDVKVNNSSVKYNLVKKGDSAETATIRFKVPNENSDIKFYMNVEPMGNARVGFRVATQNDIKKVSGETSTVSSGSTASAGKASSEASKSNAANSTNKSNTLPQTGSPITQASVSAIGGLAVVAGALSLKKRK